MLTGTDQTIFPHVDLNCHIKEKQMYAFCFQFYNGGNLRRRRRRQETESLLLCMNLSENDCVRI